MIINVKNGMLDAQELKAYEQRAYELYPDSIIEQMDVEIDGDFVNISYKFYSVPFQRIRRITGYLVGTLDRFNNAKLSEVNDRIMHSV